MADLLNTTKAVLTHVIETRSLPEVDLIKLLISQVLGYGILAGACITKLPQILLIWQAGTAEGLSTEMFEIETYTLLVAALYGYIRQLPFNTYGESVALALQNLIILALVYGYSRAPMMRRLGVGAVYVALIVQALQGSITVDMITKFAEANNVVVMLARLPQIFRNFKAGHTGTLSGITAAINVAGGAARCFTTVQAGGGAAMLRGYIVGLLLNSTMLLQIILYRKNTAKVLAAQRERADEQRRKAAAESKKVK
ncbi:hypothetical protein GPECTOR_11g74 [Gonium pectorale]|uniref:Mannose-P-dolichol utilization defect 1 protein homolog n=1 Tax=Gonium pectorale TaxID=33097 RepID=A0A150GRJ2_GONPE|nr:hypothetical protein GPECTOR_11g74 [Gonium pectorale]|eukprot:KXZ51950.1 hypothetical protein GPECTOR_11g74 [Gonium pectorale]